MRIGVKSPLSRRRRTTSKPSTSRSRTSSTIRSPPPSRARSSASAPSFASSPACPLRERLSSSPSPIASSSSTTRSLLPRPPAPPSPPPPRHRAFADEGGARLPLVRARAHAAAHLLHQAGDDGEAEAGATPAPVAHVAGLVAAVEDVRQLVARDADAVVLHHDAHLAVVVGDAAAHLAALVGKAGGVVEQVVHLPVQRVGGGEHACARVELPGEVHALRFDARARLGEVAGEELGDVS